MPRVHDSAAYLDTKTQCVDVGHVGVDGGGKAPEIPGSCWESARSSWIYMDMSPAQRTAWISDVTDKGEDDAPAAAAAKTDKCAAHI